MERAKKVSRYGPPHFRKDGYVSIWVAVVPLSRIPDDYFEEIFDDELPLTKFYGDFGFGYFDHDFMDTNGSKGRASSIEKLIGACSFSSSYVAQAVEQATERGLEKTQYVVLLYDFEYDPKQTRITKNSYMEFIGSFPYDKDAPSAIPHQSV
jgi:immunity protein 22 of polymorphic toxin system